MSEHAHQAPHGVHEGLVCAAAVALLALFMLAPEPAAPRLPDFAPLEPDAKKARFFEFLAPVVDAANREVQQDRVRLERIAARIETGRALTWYDRRTLERLAERYEVPLADASLIDDVLPALHRRVDTVPEALALVQAAKESGWGTSRFAVEGNNLYGQRCYGQDCGLAPQGRPDAQFNVASFDSVVGSVRSYVLNLNTHPQYLEFRRRRAALRAASEPLTGLALADGLAEYSERGHAYVAEIKSLIRQNELESGG